MTSPDRTRFGWASDLPTFASADVGEVANRLAAFIRDAPGEQLRVWYESIPWLQEESRVTVELDQRAKSYSAILEYELPLEFRRPDVIVLENGVVVVLELKSKAIPTQADLDQVSAYARDLKAYHRECHGRAVFPVLVAAKAGPEPTERDGVRIVGPGGLSQTLLELSRAGGGPPLSREQFLRADAYSPLPTLVRAARELFHHHELRTLKRTDGDTEPAIERISVIAHEAARSRRRHLVLLSGVPGSGKTLVGLRLVHSGFLDDLAPVVNGAKATGPAIFLSGNMALVQVLRDALRGAGGGGRTFVADVKAYVREFTGRGAAPPHNLLVFDEAQRAWDAAQVASKHQGDTNHRGLSEPELFIEFAERVPEWCVVVALIGTGQEIHIGEEGGVKQWLDAVERSKMKDQWTVHAPPRLAPSFEAANVTLSVERVLNLDTELRYHGAKNLHGFVEALVERGVTSVCAPLARRVDEDGCRLFVTRDLEAAKEYARSRYADFPESRFGIVGSSRDKLIETSGLELPPVTRFDVAAWFNRDEQHRGSCRSFRIAASEFACQGLELDFAIVAWGTDFARVKGRWSIDGAKRYLNRARIKDAVKLRTNAYRVLLTRGRDGSIAYVPPDPALDETFEFLREAGFRQLGTSEQELVKPHVPASRPQNRSANAAPNARVSAPRQQKAEVPIFERNAVAIRGQPWTEFEVNEVVRAYFDLKEAGKGVNKTELYRTLAAGPLKARTWKSVESKFQNISAVLQDLGEDWIDGLRPRTAYQQALVPAVEEELKRRRRRR